MPSSKVKQNNPNLCLQDPIALLPLDYNSSFASAKLAGVKEVRRSYRPLRWA